MTSIRVLSSSGLVGLGVVIDDEAIAGGGKVEREVVASDLR